MSVGVPLFHSLSGHLLGCSPIGPVTPTPVPLERTRGERCGAVRLGPRCAVRLCLNLRALGCGGARHPHALDWFDEVTPSVRGKMAVAEFVRSK